MAPKPHSKKSPSPLIATIIATLNHPATKNRWILAIISVLVVLSMLVFFIYMYYSSGDHNTFGPLAFTDAIEAAVEIRLEHSRILFQFNLGIIGGLSGLLIAKPEEAGLVLKDRPEIIMLISSAALLLLAVACHLVYIETIMEVYISAVPAKSPLQSTDLLSAKSIQEESELMIPDLFNDNVQYIFTAQQAFLSTGLLLAILTFYSAHKLKINPK